MSRRLKPHRQQAFLRQDGRCYYCERRMWLGDKHRAARQLQCTAEHLIARQDGGRDSADNIAAACRFCNAARHRRRRQLTAAQFRDLVQRRLRQGRWLPRHAESQGALRTNRRMQRIRE